MNREQVQNLTPEAQLALGSFEAERVRVRHEVIERAKISPRRDIVAGLLTGFAGGLAMFGFAQPKAIPLAIIATLLVVGVHVRGIHKRLDAVLHLLESGAIATGISDTARIQPGTAPNGGQVAHSVKSESGGPALAS